MSDKPKFSINSVISCADVVEYIKIEGQEKETPVLDHFVDISLRIHRGFDWDQDGQVAALCRRLKQAQTLNDD